MGRSMRNGVYWREDRKAWWGSWIDASGRRRRRKLNAASLQQARTLLNAEKARADELIFCELLGHKYTPQRPRPALPGRNETPEVFRIHLENRPADTEIGWLSFDLDTVKALTRAKSRDDALQTLPLGDYIPVLLSHVAWWVQLADLTAGITPSHSLRAQLRGLRSALADVLSVVPEAWSETTLHSHSKSRVGTAAGRLLLSRYLRLRTKVYSLLKAALSGVQLEPFAHLV